MHLQPNAVRKMKTSGVIICCLLAALTMSCESIHQALNSIDDLKEIDFGQTVPRHSLLLLYWFANEVNIDHRNTITATFNPNTRFGSHHYGNYERMLDGPPWGYQYYTVGNLCPGTSSELPGYIRNPPDRQYDGRNRDRIIFSAERQPSGFYRIDRVFLTQHDPHSTNYDPQHTYEISTNLLRQIRQLSNGNPTALWERVRNQLQSNINNSHMRAVRYTSGYNTSYYTQQRNLTRGTCQSSSSNSGFGETCACVCAVLIVVILLLMFLGSIFINAPKK